MEKIIFHGKNESRRKSKNGDISAADVPEDDVPEYAFPLSDLWTGGRKASLNGWKQNGSFSGRGTFFESGHLH